MVKLIDKNFEKPTCGELWGKIGDTERFGGELGGALALSESI
jgi:hypothetical protein